MLALMGKWAADEPHLVPVALGDPGDQVGDMDDGGADVAMDFREPNQSSTFNFF